ncbi:MAG: DUF4184 family protein [Rubrivivax sp.]|nr:DUF4184 family protein [Rubrivivax sp.]
MPWTLAHPAAILPFARGPRGLPLAGLVVGAMSPDLLYYTGHFEVAKEAHTPLGILTLCLPIGMLVALVVRALRERLVAVLPQPHRGALTSLPPRPPLREPREWLLLAAAIVLGAATHVMWDAFTHGDGIVVQAWPALREPLFTLGPRRFLVYNTLQHASTLFGVACVGIAYRRWLRSTVGTAPAAAPAAGVAWASDGRERHRAVLLAGCLLVAVMVALPLAFEVIGPQHGPFRASMILVRTVIYATTAFALLVVAAAFAWPHVGAPRPSQPPR